MWSRARVEALRRSSCGAVRSPRGRRGAGGLLLPRSLPAGLVGALVFLLFLTGYPEVSWAKSYPVNFTWRLGLEPEVTSLSHAGPKGRAPQRGSPGPSDASQEGPDRRQGGPHRPGRADRLLGSGSFPQPPRGAGS